MITSQDSNFNLLSTTSSITSLAHSNLLATLFFSYCEERNKQYTWADIYRSHQLRSFSKDNNNRSVTAPRQTCVAGACTCIYLHFAIHHGYTEAQRTKPRIVLGLKQNKTPPVPLKALSRRQLTFRVHFNCHFYSVRVFHKRDRDTKQ